MLITGQLSEYSLPLLIEILSRKGETGVLVLEHAEASGALHFVNGKLTSATVGGLTGHEAMRLADTLEGAVFRFERLSLAGISQKLWSETMEVPRAERAGGVRTLREKTRSVLSRFNLFLPASESVPTEPGASGGTVSTPSPSAQAMARYRFLLVVAPTCVFMIVFIGLVYRRPAVATNQDAPVSKASTAPATTSSATAAPPNSAALDVLRPMSGEELPGPTPLPPASAAPALLVQPDAGNNVAHPPIEPLQLIAEQGATPNKPDAPLATIAPVPTPRARTEEQPTPPTGPQTITVVLQIENGRVSQASVLAPRPGRDLYEASALRSARQRRYPASFTGQETISVRVEQP